MASDDGNITWTCDVCLIHTSFSAEEPCNVGGRPHCFDCIKARMDMVIRAVDTDPGILNGQALHPGNFAPALFGGKEAHDLYISRFDMKKQEWETPKGLRLYCSTCPEKMFVGALIGNKGRNHGMTIAGCGSCLSLLCLKCGFHADESKKSVREHRDCTHDEAKARKDARKQQLAGQTRGVDYQICPGCDVLIQHNEGCNHMTCSGCEKHFCYVCGLSAQKTEHWKSVGSADKRCLFVGVDHPGAKNANDLRDLIE